MCELIETLWNVNRKEYVIRLLYTLELIETLWNVNLSKNGRLSSSSSELIETLWNVNDYDFTTAKVCYKN